MESNEKRNNASTDTYQRVYICSPYRGDAEANAKICRAYCRMISERYKRVIPIAPHIYLTQFLDDDDPEQRAAGLAMGRAILATCQVVLLFGDHISKGMMDELKEAARLGIPVYRGQWALRGIISEMSEEFWREIVGIPNPNPVREPSVSPFVCG